MIEIYTDGGCKSNGNLDAIGGLGVAVFENKKCIKKFSKTFSHTTNNRMEYAAMILAMKLAIEKDWKDTVFYSDSKLLLSTITEWMSGWEKKGWKKGGTGNSAKIKNLDLVLELWELKKQLPLAKFNWIKAHNGDEGNELADELTNEIDTINTVKDEINLTILKKYDAINKIAPR